MSDNKETGNWKVQDTPSGASEGAPSNDKTGLEPVTLTDGQIAVAELVCFLVMIGSVLPSMASAKSSFLVLVATGMFITMVAFFFQALPIKSRLTAFIRRNVDL